MRRLFTLASHLSATSSQSRVFSTSTAQERRFDYLVIGAGSGGIASARRAAQHGKKVALIENKVVGGTCVNVGCVPKKVMFNLATFWEDAKLVMPYYAVEGTNQLKLDFGKFKSARDAYVKRLNGIYHTNLANSKVEFVEGFAQFTEANKVQVKGTDKVFTAEHILIASGSEPRGGNFEGADLCLSSDDFFSMTELPESIVVLGGGYIGVELAQIMQSMGVNTTLVARSTPLKFLDRDILDLLLAEMQHSGMEVKVDSPHTKVEKLANGRYRVVMADGSAIEADKVLQAIGRPPNTEGMGLENTKVELDKRSGHIVVDEFSNTAQSGVYALGDVIKGGVSLTPVAVRAGRILSERLFNNRPTLKMNYNNVATVVFSHPPLGSIGLSAKDAIAKHGESNVNVYTSQFGNMFYGLMPVDSHRPQSFFKLVCHVEADGTERVVGAHGMGRGIDEMMQGVSVAINMGATKQDFDNSVAIHPTASEELVLMDTKYLD